MAESVQQLVTDVIGEGSFDVTEAQALRWLNRRHRRMCARSRCYRKTVSDVTVANQRDYTLPAGTIDVEELSVDGVPYGKARHVDLAQAARGFVLLDEAGGVLAGTASAAGVAQFALYPTPTEAGKAILVYGAFLPPDLTLDGSAGGTLRIDEDLTEALVAGACATGLSRPGEARPDLAAPLEEEFNAGCDELRRRVARRYRGSGPAPIRVVGYNA